MRWSERVFGACLVAMVLSLALVVVSFAALLLRRIWVVW